MSERADLSTPLKLFQSYAHEDDSYRNEVSKAIKLLVRQGLIQEFHDRHIVPGVDWEREISQNLEAADIIALLVSHDFMASDYCYGREMTRALERHDTGEAVVVPIIVRPTDTTDAPFAKLQPLPKNGWAISTWSDRDLAYQDISIGLRTIVSVIRHRRAQLMQESNPNSEAVEDRTMDASIAPEIPVSEPREIAVQVRLVASEGLRLALEDDADRGEENRSYSARPNDVRSSQQFSLPWSRGELLRGDVDLILRVSPSEIILGPSEKQIKITAIRDTGVFTFLVEAHREATYHLNVELLCREITLADRILRTTVRSHDLPPSSNARCIASVPLEFRAAAKSAHA